MAQTSVQFPCFLDASLALGDEKYSANILICFALPTAWIMYMRNAQRIQHAYIRKTSYQWCCAETIAVCLTAARNI